jgi:hypothetical protein
VDFIILLGHFYETPWHCKQKLHKLADVWSSRLHAGVGNHLAPVVLQVVPPHDLPTAARAVQLP